MKKMLYDNVISYLVKTKNISKQDQDLYLYALKIMSRSLINLITVLAIGLLLSMLKESIILFVSFFILRKFVGGLHAESYMVCFCVSTILFVLGLLTVKYTQYITWIIIISLSCISMILIIIYSPIEHPNKKLNQKEIVTYRKFSIAVSVVITLISFVCIFLNEKSVSYSFAISQILVAFLMICGKLKYSKYSDLNKPKIQ